MTIDDRQGNAYSIGMLRVAFGNIFRVTFFILTLEIFGRLRVNFEIVGISNNLTKSRYLGQRTESSVY